MQTYELLVKNRAVLANSADMTLVRTSIGIDQIHVLFDNAEWLDFPITVTFSQGSDSVTQALVVSEVDDSTDWVAESTCLVPYEVIDMTGPIRVTFQGTNASGNHIITAAAAPLSVEESGDVDEGSLPEDVPTIDEWNQAYSNAVTAGNAAASLVSNLEGRVDGMISDALDTVDQHIADTHVPATPSQLGLIKVGDGLSVTEDGTLTANYGGSGLSDDQAMLLTNLQRLAFFCFDTTFNEDGLLQEGAKVKLSALPFTLADGVTY